MFSNIGWGEIAVLLVIGMLVFGPERLPKVAADAGRMVRNLRRMARDASADLRDDMGIDMRELRGLDPRRFFDDDDLATPARPVPAGPSLAPGEAAPFDPDAT